MSIAKNSEELSGSVDGVKDLELIRDQDQNDNHGRRVYNRRRFACVECRQQKSKCDAYDQAPEPCSKCKKKNVPCVLKKDFRRTYKRARNEAIEKRFKALTTTLTNLSPAEILRRIEQEQLALLDNSNFTKEKVRQLARKAAESIPGNSSTSATPIKVNSTNNTPGYQDSSSSSDFASSPRVPSHVTASITLTPDELRCEQKALGDVNLSSREIADTFQEFAQNYHRFLPVVDLHKGAERIYKLSPCLFWVIILIGLRRAPKGTALMTRLYGPVKAILAEITISPIIRYTPSDTDEPILNSASVYSVQAFLLYTFWPPLTSSLSADTSWNTIGTAMFQAIRVGLNCEDFSQEYASANLDLIADLKRTWVACNVVSQLVACTFGFPAYVSFDKCVSNASVERTNDDFYTPGIPLHLRQMVDIARFENQVINTLNSRLPHSIASFNSDEKYPYLLVLTDQWDKLDQTLKDNQLDDIRKFLLLVAKIHLLTYYFNGKNRKTQENGFSVFSSKTRESDFETKCGLVKCYSTVIEFMDHAYNLWRKDPEIVKYFPGIFVLSIWQTACIISKLVHSSLGPVLDTERGKMAYRNAIMITNQASILKYDMAYRFSGIMRSIWSLFANVFEDWKTTNSTTSSMTSQDFNLDITICSRMSVSVFFDCLYILKERCGMAKLKRETKEVEDASNSTNLMKEEDDDKGSSDDEEYDDKGAGSEIKDALPGEDQTRRFSNEKNPELRARKIIATVPLDPNPINASTSSRKGSVMPSPSNRTATLNPNSNGSDASYPLPKENSKLPGAITCAATDCNASGNSTIRLSANVPSVFNYVQNQRPQPITDFATLVEDTMAHGTNNQTIRIPLSEDQTSNESPNSIVTNWENWDSELVWKDVDLLLNDFAFNPTL